MKRRIATAVLPAIAAVLFATPQYAHAATAQPVKVLGGASDVPGEGLFPLLPTSRSVLLQASSLCSYGVGFTLSCSSGGGSLATTDNCLAGTVTGTFSVTTDQTYTIALTGVWINGEIALTGTTNTGAAVTGELSFGFLASGCRFGWSGGNYFITLVIAGP